jgi:hypothetical protein
VTAVARARTLSTIAVLATLAALAAHSPPLAAQGAKVVGRPVSGGRPLDADGSLRIFVLNASVRVVGWARDSVAVTGVAAKGQELLFGGTRRGLKLGLWDRSDPSAALPSRLEVHVPAGSRVWLKTGYVADVDVSGVTGGLDLNIVGGRVRVVGSPRELNVEAMDGDVEIDGSPAWLRAKSATGRITLRGAPEDVGLSTVSGAIVVDAPAGSAGIARGRFESVTGDVRFGGAVARGGALDFDTHSGAIELRLPPAASADVDVTTVAGTVDNAMSAARPITEMRNKRLAFSLGEGGASVTVRTFKGAVRLKRR